MYASKNMEIIPPKYDKLYLTITYLLFTGITLATVPFAMLALDPILFLSYGIAVLVGTLGTNVGYHRLFTHKAFKTSTFWYNLLAFFGVYGTVAGPIGWVATHLHHHRHEHPGCIERGGGRGRTADRGHAAVAPRAG